MVHSLLPVDRKDAFAGALHPHHTRMRECGENRAEKVRKIPRDIASNSENFGGWGGELASGQVLRLDGGVDKATDDAWTGRIL